MGSSSSRNLEASGRLRSRRERHVSDACFFSRRSNSQNRGFPARQDCPSESTVTLEEASSSRRGNSGESQIDCRNSETTTEIRQCICNENRAQDSVNIGTEDPVARNSEITAGGEEKDGGETQEECADQSKIDDRSDAPAEGECGAAAVAASSSSEGESNLGETGPQSDHQNSRDLFDEIPDLVRTDPSGRESRRNSGRRFWDALTRAASHRRSSTPITIVAIEEIDDNGSSTSRWNFQHWRSSSDADQADSRSMDWEERRRHVRSHVWALQRLGGGLQISHGHSRTCPAAGHFSGLCSCESHSVSEDSSTRASISRIIMLAEALFEVLDEIHRQSVALSQSANMPLSSLPAPDTVVNSIPVRLYRKSEILCEDAAQCHICLVEYEEGDQIRVLPCHHEYHQACVDKWLKEVHRVCPLCRGNVCDPESSAVTGNAEAL